MVIGRDTIPIHMINTYTQFPATGGGGGGGGGGSSVPFTIAVDASSGANNAMTGALHHFNRTAGGGGALRGIYIDFADGTSGTNGGQSSYGTASSPTRTTQTAHVRTSEVQGSYNIQATFEMVFFFGGYVRQGNLGSLSNIHWQTPSSVTTSLSNGVTVQQTGELSDTNEHDQDNTLVDGHSVDINSNPSFVPQGIYADLNKSNGSGFYLYSLRWGGGRGSPTFPAANDTISFTFTVDADAGGSTHTVIHEFIMKFI